MTIPDRYRHHRHSAFCPDLEDGAVVDSNFEGKPATFSIGDGNLLPGFEETLMGLHKDDQREFVVPPEKAFGQHNEQNLQAVAMDNFDDLEIEPGANVLVSKWRW